MNSQNLPLRPSSRGSGGASPDGRRRTAGPSRRRRRSWVLSLVCWVASTFLVFPLSVFPRRVMLLNRLGEPVLLEPAGGRRLRLHSRRRRSRSTVRRSGVVSSAETASSASTISWPKRSTASRRTSGVTCSTGCSSRSSRSSTRSCSARLPSLVKSTPTSTVPRCTASAVIGPPASSGRKESNVSPYAPLEPAQAEVAIRALGRSTERQRVRDVAEVADRAERELRRRSPT